MAANNARAYEAIDKFGLPPQDILEGLRRSQFAPPIIRDGAAPIADTEALVGTTEDPPAILPEPEDQA
jgi:hypothetical protein